jgi:hypothetical protein
MKSFYADFLSTIRIKRVPLVLISATDTLSHELKGLHLYFINSAQHDRLCFSAHNTKVKLFEGEHVNDYKKYS